MYKLYKNFLPHDKAWNLAVEIDSTPASWWSKAIKHEGLEKPLYLQDNVNGMRHEYDQDHALRKSVENGSFSYKFRRSTGHVEHCGCYECDFKNNFLQGEEFIEFLKKETHLEQPELFEMFVSAYHPGDFLSQHTDEERGIAFIFHLSWDWKPEYGGTFMLEKEEGEGYDAYVPGWGDLCIMELGETGQNHMVTQVSDLAPRPRLAITGWFNEGKK